MRSEAGKKLISNELTDLVKKNKSDITNLDKKTKESIKNGLKLELIPEVRDQFLEAVQNKITEASEATQNDLESQVFWKCIVQPK